jgi:hypothetical protein
MKVLALTISMAGFFLMMAGVGTIEADDTISGTEMMVWALVTLMGLVTWVGGVLVWQAKQ